MIKIIIDCYGGDHSPEANIDGALAAMESLPDLHLIPREDEVEVRQRLHRGQSAVDIGFGALP